MQTWTGNLLSHCNKLQNNATNNSTLQNNGDEASNVKNCSVYAEHPACERPSIVHPWLFVFGSAETAHKDACCVQIYDTGAEPHAYAEFNRASNVQICIQCISGGQLAHGTCSAMPWGHG